MQKITHRAFLEMFPINHLRAVNIVYEMHITWSTQEGVIEAVQNV